MIDPWLLERLACPVTRGPLRWDEAVQELVSEAAGLAWPVCDGVPVLLVEAGAADPRMTGRQTRLLSEAEFRAYFQSPMRDVTEDPGGAIDISPYLEAIPKADLRGAAPGEVAMVYRDASERYDHVMIGTNFHETYVVAIVDRARWDVVGHHFLDLPRLYAIPTDRLDD